MKNLLLLVGLALLLVACVAPGQTSVNTPQGKTEDYPPAIENTAVRQNAAQESWRAFLTEMQLPEVAADREPVIDTPRALPQELAGRVKLNTRNVVFDELEAKEALKRFIGRARGVLVGNGKTNPLGLNDLSLKSFSSEGNFYRAVYEQESYGLPIANGYGLLTLVVGKDGTLLQWNSTLIPKVALPVRPVIETRPLLDRFVGRTFTYSNIAGRPMSYKVASATEVSLGMPVVYPKLEADKLTLHLALPVEVGKGMTWTVYIDAITGDELGVKQNFAT